MDYTFILGILANAAQVLSVLVPAIVWKMLQCRVPWCLRRGIHPVEGTHWKVCPKHQKPEHHAQVKREHRVKFPHLH